MEQVYVGIVVRTRIGHDDHVLKPHADWQTFLRGALEHLLTENLVWYYPLTPSLADATITEMTEKYNHLRRNLEVDRNVRGKDMELLSDESFKREFITYLVSTIKNFDELRRFCDIYQKDYYNDSWWIKVGEARKEDDK